MSTSPRTRRPSLERLLASAVAAAAVLGMSACQAVEPPGAGLRCSWSVPARLLPGQPALLQMTLHNLGPETLQVLTWGTPFEGFWTGPSVALSHEGQPLSYRGPQVKRAAPDARNYLSLAPGAQAQAALDLGLPFRVDRPGVYALQPQITLADLRSAAAVLAAPAALQPVTLDCQALRFERLAAR